MRSFIKSAPGNPTNIVSGEGGRFESGCSRVGEEAALADEAAAAGALFAEPAPAEEDWAANFAFNLERRVLPLDDIL